MPQEEVTEIMVSFLKTSMSQEEVAEIIESLLKENFSISTHQFDWETTLEILNEKFNLLSYLTSLEQLIGTRFSKKIPLLENINTSVHTPKDVLLLVMKYL